MSTPQVATLGSVLKSRGGSLKTGPFGTTLKAAEYSRTGVPVVSVGEIGHGALRISKTTPRVGPEVVHRLPEYVLRAGDIVFGRKGAVDRCALVRHDEGGYFLGSDGIRVRFGTTVNTSYLAYQLQTSEARGWLLQNASGTTMASLNQEILGRLPIRLPCLAEQQVVAEALSKADLLISTLERLIAKKQAIKQGMMQQLLTGKIRLPGFTAPWTAATIAGMATVDPETLPSSTHSKTQIDYISLEDVSQGELLGSSQMVFGDAPSRARRIIRPGDVLFGTVRPNLQSHMLYGGKLRNPIASTGFAVVRANDATDPAFIF